ncbi:MAG: oxidoreductase [Cyclobacteriaceae bacterium]|nr:oxidoreductase [Cyclobacteriaceae bacterium]
MSKTALIAGASGLVGSHLILELLPSDRYEKVISIGRSKLPIDHEKLTQHIVDFDHLEENAALLKADDVFCCLGTTIKKAGSKQNFYKVDFTYPYDLAHLSKQQGAQQYNLVTAMGSARKSAFYYNRVKGELEDKVMNMGFAALNIFRPSLLLGKRNEKRLGEDLAKAVYTLFKPIMQGPLKKYRGIEGAHVAAAMAYISSLDKKGTFIYESDDIYEAARLKEMSRS